MKFYPPKLENTVPSAIKKYDNNKTPIALDFWIPFTFNLSTGIEDIDGYQYEIKHLNSNTIITSDVISYSSETIVDLDSNGGVFKFSITGNDLAYLIPGFSYKIQIAWRKSAGQETPSIGYYSTAAIFRVVNEFEWDFICDEDTTNNKYPYLKFTYNNGEFLSSGHFVFTEKQWHVGNDEIIDPWQADDAWWGCLVWNSDAVLVNDPKPWHISEDIMYDSSYFANGYQKIDLIDYPLLEPEEADLVKRNLHKYYDIVFEGYTNSGLPITLNLNDKLKFYLFAYEIESFTTAKIASAEVAVFIRNMTPTSGEDWYSVGEPTTITPNQGLCYFSIDSNCIYKNKRVQVKYQISNITVEDGVKDVPSNKEKIVLGFNSAYDSRGDVPIVIGAFHTGRHNAGANYLTVTNEEDFERVGNNPIRIGRDFYLYTQNQNDKIYSNDSFPIQRGKDFIDYYLTFLQPRRYIGTYKQVGWKNQKFEMDSLYGGKSRDNDKNYPDSLNTINDLFTVTKTAFNKNYGGLIVATGGDPATAAPSQLSDFQGFMAVYFEVSATPTFEHLYLADKDHQLRVMFNPKVSSFKTDVLETKIDTISGKYPFFLRNGDTEYKEFPISGLISLLMDENNCFYQDKESAVPASRSTTSATSARVVSDAQTNPRDLIDENIYKEYKFKMDVLDWLNNGKPKFFRSATEGSYIVRLMNVSLTPEDNLGRMLHNFSCTAYQIAENTQDNISKYIMNWGAENE